MSAEVYLLKKIILCIQNVFLCFCFLLLIDILKTMRDSQNITVKQNMRSFKTNEPSVNQISNTGFLLFVFFTAFHQ